MSVHSTSSSVWQENKDLMCHHKDITGIESQRQTVRVHVILTLVTVMKSGPKNTLFTPSISNRSLKETFYHVIVQQQWKTYQWQHELCAHVSSFSDSSIHVWKLLSRVSLVIALLWTMLSFFVMTRQNVSGNKTSYLHNAFMQSVATYMVSFAKGAFVSSTVCTLLPSNSVTDRNWTHRRDDQYAHARTHTQSLSCPVAEERFYFTKLYTPQRKHDKVQQ